MKCPYRKVTKEEHGVITENFGECYKEDCPYYGRTKAKKRYAGGSREVIEPICWRVYEKGADNERREAD